MFCVDDMKLCIRKWFGEALTTVEIAKTYHEVMLEAEKQLEYCMNSLEEEN